MGQKKKKDRTIKTLIITIYKIIITNKRFVRLAQFTTEVVPVLVKLEF